MHELSAVDVAGLRSLETLVVSDADGVAEFGGFYGQAVRRLGPLLGPGRRAWLLSHDGSPCGFLDADAEAGCVGLAWFVAEPYRRRGIATTAVIWLLNSDAFPDATRFRASIAPSNLASRLLARRAGFSRISITDDGDEIWEAHRQRQAPSG
jgi:hypothetical protein